VKPVLVTILFRPPALEESTKEKGLCEAGWLRRSSAGRWPWNPALPRGELHSNEEKC